MFQCYHCLRDTVCWDCDYDSGDYGYDIAGIVQLFHCMNCGAEIEYLIPFEKEEDDHVDSSS